MDQQIRDYIHANHDRYTPEAIRAQLIDAGHDPAAVDAEVAAFASERAARPASGTAARAYVWSAFWICAVAVLALIGLIFSLNRNPDKVSVIGLFGAGMLGGYLVLGYFVARWMSRRLAPGSAMGWVGTIILVPLALILVAYGSCTASSVLFGPV